MRRPRPSPRPAGRLWAVVAALALATVAAAPASALPRPPRGDEAEHLVVQARQARLRLDFAAASARLDEASGQDPHLEAAIVQERGLLARDRGDLDHALTLLRRAADADPTLGARVDQAGVLVQLGRWPEAVVVLRQAFDERGTSLPVEQVTADKRFVKLAALRPYQDILEAARAEQGGPFGRVLVRLERIQGNTASLVQDAERTAAWMSFGRELLAAPWLGPALLLALALWLSAALVHLRLAAPPWSLGVALLLAGGVWHGAATWASSGESGGWATVAWATAIAAALWGGGATVRLAWRRYRVARLGAGDPLAAEHLGDTLLLVDEVSRLGHRIVGARRAQQRVLAEALRQAAETLRERLERGAG